MLVFAGTAAGPSCAEQTHRLRYVSTVEHPTPPTPITVGNVADLSAERQELQYPISSSRLHQVCPHLECHQCRALHRQVEFPWYKAQHQCTWTQILDMEHSLPRKKNWQVTTILYRHRTHNMLSRLNLAISHPFPNNQLQHPFLQKLLRLNQVNSHTFISKHLLHLFLQSLLRLNNYRHNPRRLLKNPLRHSLPHQVARLSRQS
jgi:hypothetical protein